ncbi:RsmB/NOP family class I SAM-dependent RNA methyltransferase [Shewanella aegiceratis]|uniref:RsmB/NOP family class I SAM-dependent RNA methyltransferase n=1 Tax=Shewanella aegiceratis TaxID=2864203 RepID=UPI001C65CE3B|nr:RsmB/NOP family class I SAM-dependent RNA methyltransferase [Shewanella aegiceratis]QYJ81413.1 RsmB/NOP family class I SAM-dependent RNA methyltransferase [Shewanella aegiceratis]
MGDSTTSATTSSKAPLAVASICSEQLHQALNAQSGAEKRALSYSLTIHQLFCQTLQSKLPGDRILADYFRAHKKHGSKDRRVIRETLFGLFRWHGWLKLIPLKDDSQQAITQQWFAQLAMTAALETHPWQDIVSAWRGFAGLDESAINARADTDDLKIKQAMLAAAFPAQVFHFTALAPDWFWAHFDQDLEMQERLVSSLSTRPPIWGRLQGISLAKAKAKLAQQEIVASGSDYFKDAINLGHKSINLNGVALYSEGKLEIQDLGSQVIGNICAPKADESWWDACSGAGGKTLQLRSLMLQQDSKASGSVVASDIRRKPLEELTKRAKRAGFSQISTQPWQSDALPVAAGHFDGVLVDAPCSCTGTWRRNPDMRWLDDASAITDKASLQLDILSRACEAVRPGGALVYATCSISPVENQEVVEAFLAKRPDFSLQTLTHPFTHEATQMLTVLPYQADSDGMFVAKMIRQGE